MNPYNVSARFLAAMDEDNGIGSIAPYFNPASQHTFNTSENREKLLPAINGIQSEGWEPTDDEIMEIIGGDQDAEHSFKQRKSYPLLDKILNEIFNQGSA